jgi:hypothetical protein
MHQCYAKNIFFLCLSVLLAASIIIWVRDEHYTDIDSSATGFQSQIAHLDTPKFTILLEPIKVKLTLSSVLRKATFL